VYEAENTSASEEDEFNVNFVQGDLQVNILLKGGHAMTLTQIQPYVQQALNRVVNACGMKLSTAT